MFSFSQWGIRRKLATLIVLALIGLLFTSALMLASKKRDLMEEKQLKTRHLVETVHGILVHYEALSVQGKLSPDDARAAARATLRGLRYDRNEYFWINDMQPVMVMHPIRPELEGKNLSETRDPHGKPIFLAFVDTVKKSGEGVVDYYWAKPGSSEPVPKVSYVKGFAPWGWIVGSGVYVDDVDALFWKETLQLLGIVGVIALVLVGISLMVSGSITRPVGELQNVMARIQAEGDLTLRSQTRSGDEIGRMSHAFNDLIERFQDILRSVHTSAGSVSGAASQLSSAALQIKQSSASQSEAASSTAAAVEQMTVSISSVSDNTSEVRVIGQESLDRTVDGHNNLNRLGHELEQVRHAVGEMQGTVKDFMHSTATITAMTQQVKEIAEQTNLLALNAAIEAARAGEQGRGFAVVADEVRKLAEKSAESANEIESITQTLNKKSDAVESSMARGAEHLESSYAFMEKVAAILEEAKSAVERTSAGINGITSSLREQSVVTTEIARNVETIAQMTEENNAATGETLAAAEGLEQQARSLQQAVNQFRV